MPGISCDTAAGTYNVPGSNHTYTVSEQSDGTMMFDPQYNSDASKVKNAIDRDSNPRIVNIGGTPATGGSRNDVIFCTPNKS